MPELQRYNLECSPLYTFYAVVSTKSSCSTLRSAQEAQSRRTRGPLRAIYYGSLGPHQLSAFVSMLYVLANHGMKSRLPLQAASAENAGQAEGEVEAGDSSPGDGQSADSPETEQQPAEK